MEEGIISDEDGGVVVRNPEGPEGSAADGNKLPSGHIGQKKRSKKKLYQKLDSNQNSADEKQVGVPDSVPNLHMKIDQVSKNKKVPPLKLKPGQIKINTGAGVKP